MAKRSFEIMADASVSSSGGTAGLRSGPSSISELFQFPKRMWSDLQKFHKSGARMAEQVTSHVDSGLELRTAFSGVDAPLHAVNALLTMLQKGPEHLTYASACDRWAASRTVLESFPEPWRPKSVEEEICGECVPTEIMEQMTEKHGNFIHSKSGKKNSVRELVAHIEGLAGMLRHLDLSPKDKGQIDKNKLQLQIVGLDCTEYSSRGLRKREGGSTLLAMVVYLCRISQMLPHLLIIEEAPEFMAHGIPLINAILGAHYSVEAVHICPSFFGFPMTRKRTWFILRLRKGCVCREPFSLESIRCYERAVCLTGDDMFLPVEAMEAKPAEKFNKGDEKRLKSQLESLSGLPSDASKTIVNVAQNFPWGHPSVLIPSLTRDSCRLWSTSRGRLMYPEEHLFSMGLLTAELKAFVNAPYGGFIDLSSVSKAATMQLAGGSMNVQVMLAVLLHALGSTGLATFSKASWTVQRDGGALSRGSSSLFL